MSFSRYHDLPTATPEQEEKGQARLRLTIARMKLADARRAAAYYADKDTHRAVYEAECEYNAAVEKCHELGIQIKA